MDAALCWVNKASPTPNLPIKHFIIKYRRGSLFPLIFFIENKCLSNLICDGKTEKNKFGIKWIRTHVDQIKWYHCALYALVYTTEPFVQSTSFVMLSTPYSHWWAELYCK